MKQNSILFLIAVVCLSTSCEDVPDDPENLPNCEYDNQENISFIDFGLKVPDYTGTFFDNAFGINYASSDRTIYFLTEVIETRGNYEYNNVANTEIRFITDGTNCVNSKTFKFKAGDPDVGGSFIVAPAPSTDWTGDVKISIRTDAFYGEHDNEAFTVSWIRLENDPDNIIEGNLVGNKMPYRRNPQAILVPRPIYGEETPN